MATPARRRRNRRGNTYYPFWIVAFLASAALGIVVAVTRWIVTHPAVLVLTVLGAGAGGTALYTRARTAREQRRIQAQRQAQIAYVQSQEIARYHAMGPREFEDAIAYLCHRDGCTGAQRVGGAGDLGADVLAVAPDGRRIVIQCKRYGPTTKVGSMDAQRFGGTCYAVHGAQVAAIVTTGLFTAPAANYARGLGIRLFDERALAAWASRTGPAPWHQ